MYLRRVGWERTDILRVSHARAASYGSDPMPAELRLGRRAFTYAQNSRMSKAGHFACATCHLEGGEDGLVWFPSGPRQTPQLAGRLVGTAPYNWLGSEVELHDNMDQTIDRMGGEGLSEEERDSLGNFLRSGLIRPPNPHVSTDGLTEQQAAGRALFLDPQVACVSCHGGSETSDGLSHDVGTATPFEVAVSKRFSEEVIKLGLEGEVPFDLHVPGPLFYTPTLRDLFATGPYLHDGSATTLLEVLDVTAKTMGRTNHLSLEQKQALVAYLLTL